MCQSVTSLHTSPHHVLTLSSPRHDLDSVPLSFRAAASDVIWGDVMVPTAVEHDDGLSGSECRLERDVTMDSRTSCQHPGVLSCQRAPVVGIATKFVLSSEAESSCVDTCSSAAAAATVNITNNASGHVMTFKLTRTPSTSPQLPSLTASPQPTPAPHRPHHRSPRPSSAKSHAKHSGNSAAGAVAKDNQLPDGYARIIKYLPDVSTEHDEQRLIVTCRQLEQCTFYLAELSSSDAKVRLKHCQTGAFIVRDSAHPNFLYSLTVKTARGVTSIRVCYGSDGFRLDSDANNARLMPAFDSVLDLINYYVRESRTQSGKGCRSSCIFLDRTGKKDVPVVLGSAFRGRVTSLKHLCRVTVNEQLAGRSPARLCLIPSLKQFVADYPFDF